MRKPLLITVAVLLAAAPAAAQADDLDVGPGMVTPDSAFYGLEVAWDNARMGIGLASPGTVVQERAAEARAMQQRNNTDGMQRAAREMSRVAERAQSRDSEGLRKAQAVLQAVMAQAPADAQEGLQTALDNMQQARERVGQPGGNSTDDPTGTRPNGSGDFEDTPDTPTNPGNDSG